MGLGFRAWQMRECKDKNDLRKDKNDVVSPFPPYIIDYPLIVLINSFILVGLTNSGYFKFLDSKPVLLGISFYFGYIASFIKVEMPKG
jgi:hypothetical protein